MPLITGYAHTNRIRKNRLKPAATNVSQVHKRGSYHPDRVMGSSHDFCAVSFESLHMGETVSAVRQRLREFGYVAAGV